MNLKTPEARLRWLLETFLRRDLLSLSAKDLEDLESDLLAYCAGDSSGPTSFTDRRSYPPVIEEQRRTLYELQQRLRTGLTLALRADPHIAGVGWMAPHDGLVEVVRVGESAYTGERGAVVLVATANLVKSAAGKRIVKCPEKNCTHFFYRRKKALFCSRSCADKERARRHRIKVATRNDSIKSGPEGAV